MGGLIFVLIILAILGLIGAPVAYMQARKVFREQKNYERGLKMIPMLIHLPPQSEDAEASNRDVREIVDENISKAQVLYNIIASSLQKGFKSKFYGQRHFGFEIVGSKGFVQFYAAVPVALAELVKQAIVSAYPTARLEEVAEHNIFSPVGRISGTVGGELVLKENYAYPIATYQDLKRDAMQSLLNALSTLDKEDGAGIQILLRPANDVWRKNANAIATKKRKGSESKSGGELTLWWIKQLFMAWSKPPEDKSGSGSSDKKELSGLDQAVLDSIDDKTRHPGYEISIRILASSSVSQRAQAILNNIVASFALFDSPGKNGFKFSPAKDMESFATAYILRFFPPENTKNILNSVELATLFHFPDEKNIPTSQLQRQASKQVDGPRNVPEQGILLGYNIFRSTKKPIRLDLEDRRRHMYVVGQTGVGKSVFLENLALQDMLNGEGFAFIDPHGDTAEKLLSMVPRERTEDVIYFCPADMDYPMGLNLFEYHSPEQKDFLIQEAINMLYKLYDPLHQGIIGPRYEHWFRMAALTVMANPAGGTFIDIPKVFTDNQYAKELIKYVKDQAVLDFWNKEMAQTSDYHKSEVLGWFVSKFGAFLANEMMRNIIGQTKSSLKLREIMDEKKILIVNLSKGRTGELNSKLLGMIFVMQFQAAAMSRANIPEDEREDFCLYVDEFQNFSTDSFATIMSEARKYHLNLIVANQFTTQLSEEIRDAVFGNMGTIVAFRVGDKDVESLTKYFQPSFEAEDLLRVPNYNAIVRTLVGGVPTQAFSMAALPPLGHPNQQLSVALRQLSSAKYGRPKEKVEKEIFTRLKSREEPAKVSGVAGANNPKVSSGGGLNTPRTPSSNQAKPGSFLDDWLAKRKNPQPSSKPIAPGNSPPVASRMSSDARVTPLTNSPSINNQLKADQSVTPTAPAFSSQSSATSLGATPSPVADNNNAGADPIKVHDLQEAKAEHKTARGSEEISNKTQTTANKIKSHAEVKISRHPTQSQHQIGEEDTIYIDKEGILHNQNNQ